MANMRRWELKRNYMVDNITKYKFDPKKSLKKLLPNSKLIKHSQKLEGETDPTKIAEIINKYFTSIGPALASVFMGNIPTLNDRLPEGTRKFSLVTVSEEYIRTEPMKIPDYKATGIDGIAIRYLKLANKATVPIFNHVVNMSIMSQKVPKEHNTAVVIPLYKAGNKESVSNFHPVSILPEGSKVLERAVHSEVTTSLNTLLLMGSYVINSQVLGRVLPLAPVYYIF